MNIDEKFITKVANAHMYEVMANKSRYLEPDNFSTVQYMNPRVHIDLIKFKEMVIRTLHKFDKAGAYLNIGSAAGHLEYVNNLIPSAPHRASRIIMSSVEWVDQYDCCKAIREQLGVDIHYICNDVLQDDFEIFNCKTYFDNVILERFFPVYRSMTYHRIEEVLRKFVPYGRNAVVVESEGNLSKDQVNYLNRIAKDKIHISGKWHCFIVKLEQFK